MFQNSEDAVANALKMALDADLDCLPSANDCWTADVKAASSTTAVVRPTAADTWTYGETQFVIEIGGHELLASIPSTKSSVSSDPNEVEDSDYNPDRRDSDSECDEEEDGEGEYNADDDDYDDDDDDDDDAEYDEDYQFTRGDFDDERPPDVDDVDNDEGAIEKVRVRDSNHQVPDDVAAAADATPR
jgi:hypothetical protein